ncbi:MAG: glycosyltransferase family 2 protein [Candidatus Dormibacteria bacterium]
MTAAFPWQLPREYPAHSRAGGGPVISLVGVIVPAHNEEALLGVCLDSIDRAVSRFDLPTLIVVVLDSCTDNTAAVVAARPRVRAVNVAVHNVGRARARGFQAILRLTKGVDPGSLWFATTDADGTVPEQWLAFQVDQANRGVEVVLGTVRVNDWGERPPQLARRFAAQYGGGDEHAHVHGANLGISAAAYLAAGGWPPLATAEDHALARLVDQRRVLRTAAIPVTTSSRSDSRAPRGFAGYLDSLDRTEDPLETGAEPG